MTEAWPHGAPAVGDAAELTRTVGPDDIGLFTEISGDRNPLHYDEAAAKASRFGEIVVQGGVTSAVLNAVVAEKLPGPGTVFLNVSWDFKGPVRPGDTITGRVGGGGARAPATKADHGAPDHGDAGRRRGRPGRHRRLLHDDPLDLTGEHHA